MFLLCGFLFGSGAAVLQGRRCSASYSEEATEVVLKLFGQKEERLSLPPAPLLTLFVLQALSHG